MARKKKSRNKNSSVEKIVLATAIINLLKALIDTIKSLTG